MPEEKNGRNNDTEHTAAEHCQVKRLDPGTFVEIYDPENNMAERCRVVQYGREKRLQSLRRDNTYFRIKEMHGYIFRMGA